MALNFLPLLLQAGGTLLSASGASQAANGATTAGRRSRQAKEYEATELEGRAKEVTAAAQQKGFEERRRARLVASRIVALSAAGGGGASDPTVMKMLADVEGEGVYRQAVQVYQGEDEARTMRMRASGARYEGALAEETGRNQARAYKTAGVATLLTGGGSLYAKYGIPGPTGGQIASSDFLAGGITGGGVK